MLGKDISLMSDKTPSLVIDDNPDDERKLALEICLTSLFFKNLKFDMESEKECTIDEI